jgi:hypothetical protein
VEDAEWAFRLGDSPAPPPYKLTLYVTWRKNFEEITTAAVLRRRNSLDWNKKIAPARHIGRVRGKRYLIDRRNGTTD